MNGMMLLIGMVQRVLYIFDYAISCSSCGGGADGGGSGGGDMYSICGWIGCSMMGNTRLSFIVR